ncbi:hypothetical protein Lser_V15G26689 [Lactuca serriola]
MSCDADNGIGFRSVCGGGSERQVRMLQVSMQTLKKWSWKILKGLDYLHRHEPCIIHTYLNCSNVFINGNISKVKIGDLGLAAIVGKSHCAHSILGTPEFMNLQEGDIEKKPFMEALRQLFFSTGPDNFCLIHVSLVPVLGVVGEQKTKPTHHSVWELQDLDLIPHFLACRSAQGH